MIRRLCPGDRTCYAYGHGGEVSYEAIIERGDSSWGAYVPDLPGCVAVAATLERVEQLIREAVDAHIELLRERGEAIPAPSTFATIDVDAA
jgi:predicted RNase H-like HicB family nuclease